MLHNHKVSLSDNSTYSLFSPVAADHLGFGLFNLGSAVIGSRMQSGSRSAPRVSLLP